MTTTENIVKEIIGNYVIQLASLQAELANVKEELAALKEELAALEAKTEKKRGR